MSRSILRRHVLFVAALALAGSALVTARADEAKPKAAKAVDVVICLDVSGSMEGLIDSARLKLWDIVNDLGKVDPAPKLRVGLYSYGHNTYDSNKGWVRKDLDLSNDLDEVYKKLFGLTINGGEEYVARVCRDAIQEQKWSEEKDALKVIFVCGNEPASQDPHVKLKDVGDLATKKGIVINPIYCGPATDDDARDWKEFSKMAGGRFNSIDHDRGAVAIATPVDKDLTALSAKLNTTYIVYGNNGKDKEMNQSEQDKNAEKLGVAVTATRAVSKSSKLYCNDSWDLVDRCLIDPKFDVKTCPVEELNDEMKKMKPEEREKYVKEMMAKRAAIQKDINELNTKREVFVREYKKKNVTNAEKAFDEAVRATLCDQAAAKGIVIPRDK